MWFAKEDVSTGSNIKFLVRINFIINLATIDTNRWMIFVVACEHSLSAIAIAMDAQVKISIKVDWSNMLAVITVLVALLGKTTTITVTYPETSLNFFQLFYEHKL